MKPGSIREEDATGKALDKTMFPNDAGFHYCFSNALLPDCIACSRLKKYWVAGLVEEGIPVDAQMKKGLLDICVLYILKKEDTYGYKLTQEITELLQTSESALYPVLRRLESQGLLETYSQEHSGRLRRYYRITGQGIVRFNEMLSELTQLKRIIDYISGGEQNE